MRNNNLLKATISVALSLVVGGTAQAALYNVDMFTGPVPVAATAACTATGNTSDGTDKKTTMQITVTAPAVAVAGQIGGSRVFCVSDTATTPLTIKVPNDANPEASGIAYASEMFGGSNSPSLPTPTSTSGKYAAAIFDTYGEGIADVGVRLRFELSDGAKFAEKPRLIVSTGCDPNKDAVLCNSTAVPGTTNASNVNNFGEIIGDSASGGGAGFNFVYFDIPASVNKSLPINANPAFSEWVLLLYKINQTASLATPTATDNTGAVKMTVSATSEASAGKNAVFRSSTTAIARSKSAVSVQILKEKSGDAAISVETGSNRFSSVKGTGNVDGGGTCQTGGSGNAINGQGVFVNDSEVQIGCVVFNKAAGTYSADGTTPFSLGDPNSGDLTDDGKLSITSGGQFAASKVAPGAVMFGPLSVVPTDDTTVEFALKASDIKSMMDTCIPTYSATECRVPIRFKVDNDAATFINVEESEPVAELALTFKNASFNSTAISAKSGEGNNENLRKITEDGKTCMVWNVPAEGTQDKINIRVTNISKAPGKLFGRLWGMDGKIIGTDNFVLAEEIKVKETLHFDLEKLKKAVGTATWTGRARLEIRSNLSDIEVLGMLRSIQGNGQLSNLSLGAHGNSCNKTLTNHKPGF